MSDILSVPRYDPYSSTDVGFISFGIKALLIDLSGTLHIGTDAVPGAVEAIQRLRAAGFPFRFCSNTSKESTNALLTRLRQAGFEVYPNEIFTSLGAMANLLKQKGVKRPYLLLSPSAEEDFQDYVQNESSDPYDAVVVGLAPTKFTYDHLNAAFRILSSSSPPPAFLSKQNSPNPSATLNSQIPLFTTHRARYIRSQTGELSLGPGPFVAALETAVGEGLKAVSVGKPERAFFEICLRDLGIQEDEANGKEGPSIGEVAVIGDDVEADLAGGAIELGLKRVLVKTRKYRPGDENRTSAPPDAVFESIGHLIDTLLQSI